MANEPQTPVQVADAAAIPDALPLGDLTLIGLFADAAGPAALLRGPDGTIARVTTGETALGVTIVALSDTAAHVTDRRGAARILQMPAG